MYWTELGDHPKIERADLNGTNRQTLVSGNMGLVHGLALDDNGM